MRDLPKDIGFDQLATWQAAEAGEAISNEHRAVRSLLGAASLRSMHLQASSPGAVMNHIFI